MTMYKMREKLGKIRDEIGEMVDFVCEDDEEKNVANTTDGSVFKMGLAKAQEIIRAGQGDIFQVGDHLIMDTKDGKTITWIVIDAPREPKMILGKQKEIVRQLEAEIEADRQDEEQAGDGRTDKANQSAGAAGDGQPDGENQSAGAAGDGQPGKVNQITLWAANGLEPRPFDEASDEYPYGHNRWATSSLREWLNGEFLETLQEEDAAAIAPVLNMTYASDRDGGTLDTTEDRLWLLSLSEIGFEVDGKAIRDEGHRYPFFDGPEKRNVGDWFRLRSAYRGYASIAWNVGTSGYAGNNGATLANRPCPACVIC